MQTKINLYQNNIKFGAVQNNRLNEYINKNKKEDKPQSTAATLATATVLGLTLGFLSNISSLVVSITDIPPKLFAKKLGIGLAGGVVTGIVSDLINKKKLKNPDKKDYYDNLGSAVKTFGYSTTLISGLFCFSVGKEQLFKKFKGNTLHL